MATQSWETSYTDLQSQLRGATIPALDGIRAIAVFLVIFYHLGLERGLPILPGPLGVLRFFVLSGFLITWLLAKEDDKFGSISLTGFYQRRALRIFPAFYVYWCVEVALRLVRGGGVRWSQALSAFFYVSNYHHAIFRPRPEFMMHTWSLSVEEQFYLLWPLCFLAFTRKRKLLMGCVSVVVIAVWAHRIQLWSSVHAKDYISYAFDTRVDAILVGCLLAIALREGMGRKILGWACRPAWGPAVTVLLIAASTLAGQSNTMASQGYRFTCGLALEPFLVAVLICQLIVQSKAGVWKRLNSRVAGYLGRISYPLYLYHGLATAAAIRLAGTNKIVCAIATVLFSVMVASGSYYLVEKPFLALKKGRVRRVEKTEVPLPLVAPDTLAAQELPGALTA